MNLVAVLGGAASCVVTLGAAWYMVSPMSTLSSMKTAFDARDAQALSRHIDFAALEDDVAADIRAGLALRAPAPGDVIGALGMRTAVAVTEAMSEIVISPFGLSRFLTSRPAETNETAGDDAGPWGLIERGIGASGSIRRDGLSGFTLQTRDGAGDFVFRRHGFGWKLVGLDVPGSPAPSTP